MIAESAALKALLLLYSRAQTVQIAESALAFARFSIEERLARWILMCHDRHGYDDIPLTHELLSVMLGTRRAGVTTTLHILEGAGMIRSTRGNITVRDRSKLSEAAGGSYGGSEAEYNRLFPFANECTARLIEHSERKGRTEQSRSLPPHDL